jgi:hypothetical protein
MESWIRSRDRGVDPSLKAALICASGDKLEYLCRKNRDICEAASDCVAPLAPLFSDLQAALVTTDPVLSEYSNDLGERAAHFSCNEPQGGHRQRCG